MGHGTGPQGGPRSGQRGIGFAPGSLCQIIPGIESHYWWQSQLESASECQIIFKTRKVLMAALGEVIQAHHPYEVPECVSVAMQEGLPSYLQWIDQETDQSPTNA